MMKRPTEEVKMKTGMEVGEGTNVRLHRRIGAAIRGKIHETGTDILQRADDLEPLRDRGVSTPYLAITYLLGKITFVISLVYFTTTGILADQKRKVSHICSYNHSNNLISHTPIMTSATVCPPA